LGRGGAVIEGGLQIKTNFSLSDIQIRTIMQALIKDFAIEANCAIVYLSMTDFFFFPDFKGV
jgi:hypothetical protein